MDDKSNNTVKRSRFIELFGLGFVGSIFTKNTLSAFDNSSTTNNSDSGIDSKMAVEPKANILSVSRQKNL
jgi:hypothetical protein